MHFRDNALSAVICHFKLERLLVVLNVNRSSGTLDTIVESLQVSALAAIKAALLPRSSEPPSHACGCRKGHTHRVWQWERQGKSQTSPLVPLSLSKQSDHTVVIKAIRWEKAEAKSKLICRLNPDFSGVESVTLFGRKGFRNISQPCFARIMWIVTGFQVNIHSF